MPKFNAGKVSKAASRTKAMAAGSRKGAGTRRTGTGKMKTKPGGEIRSKTGPIKGPDKGAG